MHLHVATAVKTGGICLSVFFVNVVSRTCRPRDAFFNLEANGSVLEAEG